MKKSLIALAALAATGAFAQSSVSIDGILDAGVQQVNYKGAGNTVTGINGNGSSTSQINFRGSEDLGGGMRATFRFETDWNMASNRGNTGAVPTASTTATGTGTPAAATYSTTLAGGATSTFGNGEIRVGLSGGFGAVDVGVVNYNTLSTYLTGQPFGTAIGSGFRTFYVNDAQATSQVRADNSVKYTTPVFNGFRAVLYKSQRQNAATSANYSTVLGAYDMAGTQEIGLNYGQGPIAASFTQLKQDYNGVSSGNPTYTINTFGANYTMGAAKLFALYQTNKSGNLTSNTIDRTAMSVSATYTVGNTVLMTQIGQLKENGSSAAGLKSKLWAIGADYNLSKRSAIYLRAESIDDQAKAMNAALNPATIANTTSDANKFARTAIGIRHSF